jgi:vomeronasal1 receptor
MLLVNLYFNFRVARGVFLGSTSLLSIVQVITISHSNSRWLWFKVRAPKFISPSLVLCWVLQMLVNVCTAFKITNILDGSHTAMKDLAYCAVVDPKTLTD